MKCAYREFRVELGDLSRPQAFHIGNQLLGSLGKICLSPRSPRRQARSIFFSDTLLYTDQPTEKTAPSPVACLPFYRDPPKTDSPLPFPDSEMVLMWIGGSQIYVTQSRPLARKKG